MKEMIGNRIIDLLQMERGPRDRGRRGVEKEMKIQLTRYICLPTPHKECNHYVLQTWANKQ